MLHRVDQTGNACPSMHVAVAIFTAVRIDEVLRATRAPLQLRMLNVAWFSGHRLLDTWRSNSTWSWNVIAGALLGTNFCVDVIAYYARESRVMPVTQSWLVRRHDDDRGKVNESGAPRTC
ncbi:MAG: hypothetical protein WDM77_02460 [Steroidobacteraceae bacterium]